MLSRWIPATPAQEDVVAALWVVRLAADGLWVHQSFSNKALPASLRKRIGRMLLDMIPRSEKSTQVSKEDADQ